MNSISNLHLVALDFDGVICNGLKEYFQTTKKAYQKIWSHDTDTPLDNYEASFCKLRPVIETGWEMPVLLRVLVLNISSYNDIIEDWPSIAKNLAKSEQLDSKTLSNAIDNVRDEWIKTDLDSWLSLHEFYPGVITKIKEILSNHQIKLYIITTKEGRFVKKLLTEADINLDFSSIFGKEVKQPKYETLRQLIAQNSPNRISFVEDRLEALKLVQQQPDLNKVQLYLADWGYNTAKTRAFVNQESDIKLLSLAEFTQNFAVE